MGGAREGRSDHAADEGGEVEADAGSALGHQAGFGHAGHRVDLEEIELAVGLKEDIRAGEVSAAAGGEEVSGGRAEGGGGILGQGGGKTILRGALGVFGLVVVDPGERDNLDDSHRLAIQEADGHLATPEAALSHPPAGSGHRGQGLGHGTLPC